MAKSAAVGMRVFTRLIRQYSWHDRHLKHNFGLYSYYQGTKTYAAFAFTIELTEHQTKKRENFEPKTGSNVSMTFTAP